MFAVLRWFADNAGIAERVATIFNMISQIIGIYTMTNGGMCFGVSDFGTHSSVKCVEVTQPISVIVGVYVLYHSSLQGVKVI